MKTRLKLSFVTAGTAFILLTGCVSSKKYHASQAETARVRADSAQLAQQVSTLNGNVQDLQNKNTSLQQSLDASNNRNATTQKSLDYYQGYFKEQQATMNQVSDDVKGALVQAGINNGDVQQVNNVVYVRLDEDELFKKNSTVVTPGGKKALDNLAGVIKARSNVNVFVGGGDSTGGTSGSMSAMDNSSMSNSSAMTPTPVRHHRVHHAASTSATTSGGAQSSGATAGNTGATAPKKVHHYHSSEGSMALSNRPHMRHSWAVKQGRMVAVADHFLKNGVSKVNVSLQQHNMDADPTDKSIKVVITPKMEDFNPQSASAAAARE